MNDAILIIAPGDEKKFVVCPHGGPRGMYSTYFSRLMAFFYLNGWSIALVNYRGSTGYPVEVQKSLFGKVAEQDAADVVEHIDRIRARFTVAKLGIWGWSHGGYLATAVAGKYPDKIDFALAGAPVVNHVSQIYTSDIPDWALCETGVKVEADGEIEMSAEILATLWKHGTVQYAKDVKVPMLLIHGKNDRRVPLSQSVDFYLAMRRNQKPVKLLIYDNNGHSMKLVDAWDDMFVTSVEFFEDPLGFITREEPDEPDEKETEKPKA
jgi:acylaminoacyl-peptidase